MEITFRGEQFLLKAEVSRYESACIGCTFKQNNREECLRIHEELSEILPKKYFNDDLGGCGLDEHILVRNTAEDINDYLFALIIGEDDGQEEL